MLDLYAQLVAEGHLTDRLRHAVALHRVGGNDPARFDILKQLPVAVHHLPVHRQVVAVPLRLKHNDLTARLLELGGNDILVAVYVHCKGNQSGGHVDLAVLVVEGPGHAVLAADGGQAEAHLGAVSPKERRKGLAPALRILVHPAEILLEGETDLAVISARSHDLSHGGEHRVHSPMVGAPAGQIGVKAVAHHGHSVRAALQHRKLGHHGLSLGELVFSAVGHKHAARADRPVKPLHQSLLGTHVESGQHIGPGRFHVAYLFAL